MKPGRILFIRMLADAYSSANSFVNTAKSARIAPEVGNEASGSKAANVEMLTTAPPPRDSMIGVTNRTIRTAFRKQIFPTPIYSAMRFRRLYCSIISYIQREDARNIVYHTRTRYTADINSTEVGTTPPLQSHLGTALFSREYVNGLVDIGSCGTV